MSLKARLHQNLQYLPHALLTLLLLALAAFLALVALLPPSYNVLKMAVALWVLLP